VSVTDSLRHVRATRPVETRLRRWPRWLILCCYLLAAVALTWRLWADPAGRAQMLNNGISNDIYGNAFFMRYAATAVSHGTLPALYTKALNAPHGLNMMWNTGMLLPGVLLAPVTLLAGPQVSLTIVLTLGFAGSAGGLFLVLRRWGVGVTAAAIGGAVYGFSPALRIAADTHYFLEFAVLPPVIADAVLRLLTGRGHAVRTGVLLGLLISAQLFISEEIMADTALAAAVMVLVLAASRPSGILARAKAGASGLATGAGVALLICGYPLWVQFHGPYVEHGVPWDPAHFGNLPVDFVTAPLGLLFPSPGFAKLVTAPNQVWPEYLAYVGWPLLVLLAAAAIFYWRDLKVRVPTVTFAILEAFSMGPNAVTFDGLHYPARFLPWFWLRHVPLVGQILPNRISILADGAAAAALAFALHRARESGLTARPWRRYTIAVVTAAALVPLIPASLQAAPLVPPPSGWQAAFSRLHLSPDASVFIVPANSPQVMDWQATTARPGSIIGGYCLAPTPSGRAGYCDHLGTRKNLRVIHELDNLYVGTSTHLPYRRQFRMALAHWHAAAVVAVATSGSLLGRFLIRSLGRPTVQVGRVLGWRLRRRSHNSVTSVTDPLRSRTPLAAGRLETEVRPRAH
jgi:hypothetical protein